MSDLTLLDCTLRDGGYYNNWNFSSSFVSAYLDSCVASGIDIVELGFRLLSPTGFKGPYAFTSESFVSSLSLPAGLKYSVMINASDFTSEDNFIELTDTLFPKNALNSPITLVRIASHFSEISIAFRVAALLKSKGFQVAVNLMQISLRSEADIYEFVDLAIKFELDVIYIADSLGSLTPNDTSRIVQLIRSRWDSDLGIHAHNNLNLALSNSLSALSSGATWIDSTVLGMGRGPGNTKTEDLLIELSKSNHISSIFPLAHFITLFMNPLHDLYKWGPNLYYYLAGKYKIHPNYIQLMLSDKRYDNSDILSIVEHLASIDGHEFSPQLISVSYSYSKALNSSWSPESLFANKSVLLLAPGDSVQQHREAISQFASSSSLIVFALNTSSPISTNLIDYRIACHPVRLLIDHLSYESLDQPLILPYSMLSNYLQSHYSRDNILDFGINVVTNKFLFNPYYCDVPAPLAFAYALAMFSSAKVSSIYLAGFDGYPSGDSRNDEINQMLEAYASTKGSIEPVSITPSIYSSIVHSSVYSYRL